MSILQMNDGQSYAVEAGIAEAALAQIVEILACDVDDRIARIIAAQVQGIVRSALQLPNDVAARWNWLCARGLEGDVAGVHARRQSLVHYVDRKLAIVRLTRQLGSLIAARNEGSYDADIPLRHAEERLLRFKNDILDPWQTLEDLEDLLAASFPLSNEELKLIASKNPPADSWYQEEGKPF
jgi:hypothetical protein